MYIQLHFRKAKILRIMKKYDHAIQSIDDAVKLVPRASSSTREKARDLLALLRTQLTVESSAALRLKAREKANEAKNQADVMGRRQRTAERVQKNFYASMLPPDVLMNICDIGLGFNSDFGVKMGQVCGFWRKAVRKQKGLWGKLVLRGKQPARKVKAWRQLSGGVITTLIFAKDYDSSKDEAVLSALGEVLRVEEPESDESCSHLEFNVWGRSLSGSPEKKKGTQVLPRITVSLRHLEIHATTSAIILWQDRCQALQSIIVTERRSFPKNSAYDGHTPIDLGLCSPALTPTLKQLEYHEGAFAVDPARLSAYSRVVSVRLKNCFLFVTISQPEFLAQVPLVECVEYESCHWRFFEPVLPSSTDPRKADVKLSCLTSYSHIYDKSGSNTPSVSAPNLLTLACFGSPNKFAQQIEGNGINLSKLVSLDLGKTMIDTGTFSRTLAQLTSLKFLNVSTCGLKDEFLSSISHRDGLDVEDQLLPSLEALSIANSEISTLALRDFINSRLPVDQRMVIRREPPKKVAKSASAFRPSSSKRQNAIASSSTPKTIAVGSASSLQSKAKTSSTQMLAGVDGSFFSTQFTPTPRIRPQISWLCVDGCERLNPDLIPVLKKHVKYVSWWMGTPNEDRQRGLGRWRWDEGCESCIDEIVGDCHMRQKDGESVTFRDGLSG